MRDHIFTHHCVVTQLLSRNRTPKLRTFSPVIGLLILFATAHLAQAQWLTNTTTGDAYNNNSSGKVGIGTPNPLGQLSIVSPSVEALGVGYQGTNSNRLLFGAEFNGTMSAESNVGFIAYGPTAAGGSARSIAFGSYTGS